MEISEKRLLGAFLSTGTFGVDDSPDNSGWIINSDSNGGTSNYVEVYVIDSTEGVSISWSLTAPDVEASTTFHIGVHHGGGGAARSADTGLQGGLTISVGPIPENFPQLSEWNPVTKRDIGESTVIQATMDNVTSANLEWKISGTNNINSISAERTSNEWKASLPAALDEGSLEYRWRISNAEFETTSAWTTLSSDGTSVVDVNPARLLMLSLAMITASLLISIQRFMAQDLISSTSKLEHFEPSKDRSFDTTNIGINMNDPRRPSGWSDEQWEHYGPDYLVSQGDVL